MNYIKKFWNDFPELIKENELPKVHSKYVQKLLTNPQFVARLKQPVKIDSTHDIPYLAGYSKDGRTVFFDRHFRPFFRYKGKIFDTRDFILVHEVGEKAILDLFHLQYQQAHHIITHLESEVVRTHGINWWAYCRFLKPQIKGIYHDQIKKVPKTLDTKQYSDEKDKKILEVLKQGNDIRPYHYKISPLGHRKRH